MARIDVLIPTFERAAALAVTLTSLIGQTWRDFRVIISDQTERGPGTNAPEVQAAVRVLRAKDRPTEILRHLPRRGMAEQRQFLFEQVNAPYALFIDDDVILEPDVIERMLGAIEEERCGFVGCAVIGLSHLKDERPHEGVIDFWEGPVSPEKVHPGSPAWERYRLHNAANLFHVQQRLAPPGAKTRKYRIAWVGGCVLYDAACLRRTGGFGFWRELPINHCGEDVLAQLRVMARFGGCGLLPSGVYHQELPTTLADRSVDAPKYLDLGFNSC